MSNMAELFYKAREFGKVSIYTFDDGCYSCTITFNTVKHIELKAASGSNCKTVESALQLAIKKAIEIVKGMSNEAERLKLLING